MLISPIQIDCHSMIGEHRPTSIIYNLIFIFVSDYLILSFIMHALSSMTCRPTVCGRALSHMQGSSVNSTPFVGPRAIRIQKSSSQTKINVAAPVEISPEERPVYEVRRRTHSSYDNVYETTIHSVPFCCREDVSWPMPHHFHFKTFVTLFQRNASKEMP